MNTTEKKATQKQPRRFYRLCDFCRLTGMSRKAVEANAKAGKIPFLDTSVGYIFDPVAIKELSLKNAELARKAYLENHPGEQYTVGDGVNISKLIDIPHENF